jgi:Zn-dependent peptidase ImmA (M78 family)/transcriptional regulator with XRE-family HTH domain
VVGDLALAANPVMLATARQARGLTQAELARQAGLSQAFVSKAEAGQVELEGEKLARVADALRFPVSLLCLAADAHSLVSTCVFHRKRSSMPVSKIRQVHASLDLARVQVEALLQGCTGTQVRISRMRPTKDGEVSARDIARRTRQELGLSDGPVPDLTSAVESAGVVILSWDFGNRQGDAVSQWLPGHRPIILMYSAAPGDRQRFSLAHELGHAVMHTEPMDLQEQQANQFASELLLPAKTVRPELDNLDMPSLARLKVRWGVSMAALIRRARDLGSISDYRYKELSIELSKAGWRSREPVEIHPELPQLVAKTVANLRKMGLDESAIAERARIDVRELSVLLNRQEAA